jgi:hypothetical protein
MSILVLGNKFFSGVSSRLINIAALKQAQLNLRSPSVQAPFFSFLDEPIVSSSNQLSCYIRFVNFKR